MNQETSIAYQDIQSTVNPYHIPEFLDFLNGEKDMVYSAVPGRNSFPELTSLFDDSPYFVHTGDWGVDDQQISYYCITKDPHPPKMTRAKIEQRGLKHTGDILDYPECCNDAHQKYIHQQASPYIAHITEFQTAPFELNRFRNDYTVISHFPCNLSCTESLKIASRRLDFVETVDPALAETIEEKLRGLVIHHPQGEFMTTNYSRSDDVFHVDDIVPISDSYNDRLNARLSGASEIRVDNLHQITVDGIKIANEDITVIAFS